jgi:WD40 repeat protein
MLNHSTTRFVTSSTDSTVRIWDINHNKNGVGEAMEVLEDHNEGVKIIAMN